MKPREIQNILIQTITAAWWSGCTAFVILLPMVLIGVPSRVAVTVLIALTLITSGLTCYGAICLQRERQRRGNGQCIRCGTDIRNATDRCPKCGKRFSRPPQQASLNVH